MQVRFRVGEPLHIILLYCYYFTTTNITSANTTTATTTAATNTTVIIMVSGKISREKVPPSNIFPFSVLGGGERRRVRVKV